MRSALTFSSGTPCCLRRDSEIDPSQSLAMFFQVNLHGDLAALVVRDELDSIHGSIVVQVRTVATLDRDVDISSRLWGLGR
jgi:hypothetical protein